MYGGFGGGELTEQRDAPVGRAAEALDPGDIAALEACDARGGRKDAGGTGLGVGGGQVDQRAGAGLAQGFAVGNGLRDDGHWLGAGELQGLVGEGIDAVGE